MKETNECSDGFVMSAARLRWVVCGLFGIVLTLAATLIGPGESYAGIKQVAARYNTVALLNDGTVRTLGLNGQTYVTPSAAESPFGLFNPYEVLISSEMLPAITRTQLNGYLTDLGAKWAQGMPPVAPNSTDSAIDDLLKTSIQIYSRVFPAPNTVPQAVPLNLDNNIQRYKDTVKYWEIDTEPNGEWPSPGQTVSWKNYSSQYATFIKVSSQTIKQACPDCKVVFGGLIGDCTTISSSSPSVQFLRSVLQAGAAQYIDAFEFKQHHHKASEVIPLLKNKMDVYSAVFAEFGIDLRSMPVFIETANYDGTPASDMACSCPTQTEREQAAADVKEHVYALSIGITKIFRNQIMESYQAPSGPSGVFQFYGLINNPLNADKLSHKKLAYYTYKKMVEILDGSEWESIQTVQESGGIYTYKVIKNGKPVYVAWWDYYADPADTAGTTKEIVITGVQGNIAVITEAVPTFNSGGEVVDYATSFNKKTVPVVSGTLTMSLGDSPVFVEVQLDLDNDGDGYTVVQGDCNDADPAVHPGAAEVCGDLVDNDCNGLVDASDPACLVTCTGQAFGQECGVDEYCRKAVGSCGGSGICQPLPTACPQIVAPVCGCDGVTYQSECEAQLLGVNIAAIGACGQAVPYSFYFPAIKDNDAIGWENYLTVQAKEPVPMEATLRVYDMAGNLKGTFIYSNSDPAANALALAPNARVALRPSWIVGTPALPIAIEGSVVVETSVPAIASTNCIANFYKGFSIYEAAKPRQVHNFPKAFDGPAAPFFQVYMLAQNIHDQAINVTVKLYGKTAADPGHGATKTYTIPAHGTLKVRPIEVAPLDPVTGKAIDFSGSVVIASDLATPGDGLGPAIPAMCRYEAGTEALAIYESTVAQPALAFPVIKDGKFGGAFDYQNFVSVVNPSSATATITMILYNKAGVEEGRVANNQILPGGKKTWRPSWIKGTLALPKDFEGSIVVSTDIPVVGQTNTIYPASNPYGADAFDLAESSIPAPSLFFPKVYDNLLGSGTGATHLTDNFVYIQNTDGTDRNVTINLYNNNGTLNRTTTAAIPPHATHVFRPKDLVTDGTGAFRGSVRITETAGLPVAGGIKYEVHKTTAATSGIEAMTIYRSMTGSADNTPPAPAGTQPTINITMDLHCDPFPALPLTERRAIFRQQMANATWLLDYLTLYGAKVSFLAVGEFYEFCVEATEKDVCLPLLARLKASGGILGTHLHPQYFRGSHDWSDIPNAYTNPAPADVRMVWEDGNQFTNEAIRQALGLTDTAAIAAVNTAAESQVHLQDPTLLMEEFGYTIREGGADQLLTSYFSHVPWNPFRPGQSAIIEDLTTRFVTVPQGMVIGQTGLHLGRWQDGTAARKKTEFLQLLVNWAERARQGEAPKVWSFGWGVHTQDLNDGSLSRAAFMELIPWLSSEFVTKVSATGAPLARFASYLDVRDAYRAWETAHPGESSFTYPVEVTDYAQYPYLEWANRYLRFARYETRLAATGADVFLLRAGDYELTTPTTYPLVLAYAPGGSSIVDLSATLGTGTIRRVRLSDGNLTTVSASSVTVDADPAVLCLPADGDAVLALENAVTGTPCGTGPACPAGKVCAEDAGLCVMDCRISGNTCPALHPSCDLTTGVCR